MVPVESIQLGAELLFTPTNLFYVLVGLLAGFVVGVLPGFGGANAAAIALPFTIGLPIEGALLLMVGIYSMGYMHGERRYGQQTGRTGVVLMPPGMSVPEPSSEAQ
jgi:TctA family transporter